jgi:hypothetical protein
VPQDPEKRNSLMAMVQSATAVAQEHIKVGGDGPVRCLPGCVCLPQQQDGVDTTTLS